MEGLVGQKTLENLWTECRFSQTFSEGFPQFLVLNSYPSKYLIVWSLHRLCSVFSPVHTGQDHTSSSKCIFI